ncbi:hypothetical protein T439DRAFT_383482 [Meredithblackwellia eburnea MCA 4105]
MLPPEILHQIFKLVLDPVSHDSGASSKRYQALSKLQLVNKFWYHLALQHLHELVHLTSIKAIQSFTALLSQHPATVTGELRPPVKWLWIDLQRDGNAQGGRRARAAEIDDLLRLCSGLRHLHLDNLPALWIPSLFNSKYLESLEVGDITNIVVDSKSFSRAESLPNLTHMSILESPPPGNEDHHSEYPVWIDSLMHPNVLPALRHLSFYRQRCGASSQFHRWSTFSVGQLGPQIQSLSIGETVPFRHRRRPVDDQLLLPELGKCTSLQKLQLNSRENLQYILQNPPSTLQQVCLPWNLLSFSTSFVETIAQMILPEVRQISPSAHLPSQILIQKHKFEDWCSESDNDSAAGDFDDELAVDSDDDRERRKRFDVVSGGLKEWCLSQRVQLVETEVWPVWNGTRAW